MNEPPVIDPLVHEAGVQSRNRIEKSLSDRILGYAFVGSVVINIIWVALVSNSNLFGKGGVANVLHERPMKVFKPIPVKPKPKPVKPPPPPPKPKLQKIKPIIHPPRPTPPQPTRRPVSVAHTSNKFAKTAPSIPPSPPVNNEKPFVPDLGPPTPVAPPVPPTPPAPPTPTPTPPAPPVIKSPPPAPPVVRLPPPPPPRPRNYSPIPMQEASYPEGLASDVSAEGIDPPPTGNKVVIAFTIDETGHFRNVHVRESSGSTELDNRFLEAVRRGRGTPAIQDHIPHDQPESISFSVGG